jgi:group I intron endonuclease
MITYIARNTVNGRFYIGSTKNFSRRKKNHLNSTDPYPFQRALSKNPDQFEWELFEDDSDEPFLEQALLDMWYGKEMCYNLNPEAARPPSWKGKKHSKETLEKMSLSNNKRGKQESNESRKKKSFAREKEKNPMYGKTHSQETREKIGASRKGKVWWHNPEMQVRTPSKESPGPGWVKGYGKFSQTPGVKAT